MFIDAVTYRSRSHVTSLSPTVISFPFIPAQLHFASLRSDCNLYGVSWYIKISDEYSPYQLLLVAMMVATAVAIVGAVITKEALPGLSTNMAWMWIIIYGLAAVVSNYFLIKGFNLLDAQVASLIMPLEVLFASIFGFLVYQETLSVELLIGGILIILAASLTDLVGYLKTKYT